MRKRSAPCTHVTGRIFAGGSVTHVWLMRDLYHQQHLSQPENRVLALRLGAILMPQVLRKKYAQAEVAGARTLEGTQCHPDPHKPHSAQALRLPREGLNWQYPPAQLNLTTALQHPNPTEDFCTHTLEFRYPHRRMNPSTHLVLYTIKSFWHCDLCEAFFKVSCLFLSIFSSMK